MTVETRGNVRWFNVEKGYGFIIPDDKGPDVFVHKKHLIAARIDRALRNDEVVHYTAKEGKKGMLVTSIRLEAKL